MAKDSKKIPQVTFRCTPELKESLEDLARIGRYENVSALLNEICGEYIAANRQRIINFRRSAKPINKPTFATAKKKAVDAESVTSDGDGLKGGDVNAENS